MNTPSGEPVADEASLFLALPWPTAAIDPHGHLLAVNPGFLTIFPGAREGDTVDAFLGPDGHGKPASAALPTPHAPGESWQGNWTASGTIGQGPCRILVSRDRLNPLVRWLFLPENPIVAGHAQLTPRSELEVTRMVLDHSPDFLFLRDTAGDIIFASRSFAKFLGAPEEGYETGKNLAHFLSEECLREFGKLDAETLATSEPVTRRRFHLETRAGARRLVELTQEHVLGKTGAHLGLLAFARDITAAVDRENKLHLALEEARSAGVAKGFFVANVSHEIRTPINGILGMAELCLETNLTADQRKYIQTVLDCGRSLLTLVNDILDFSKIESGRLTFEAIDFDLLAILAEAAAQFAPKAHLRGVEVVLDADPALPARLRGDPTRLRQIVYNLTSNAIKFTEHGHVVLSARVLAHTGDSVRFSVAIADTGIGIPKEKQSGIFEAFTQADATTTRRFGGTGLGLAVVKRLAELMNGSLTVESQPGVGSVFTAEIELPVAAEQPPELATILAGKTVGVLAADPIQREALARTLRGLGARVETAGDSIEAFRLVIQDASGRPLSSLLVVDYSLAKTDTHDLADLVASRAGNAGIPVITLAGAKVEPRSLARLKNLPHRHLAKPVSPAELRTLALGLLAIPDPTETDFRADDTESSRALRILLAEDNPVNQELALRRLEKLGHQVDLVADGGAAWEMLTSKRYDIALVDVQMPVLDGLKLAKRIRQMETGGAARLPLVALTALAMDSDKRECLDAGFDAFLSKPFLIEDLRRTLATLVPDPATAAPPAAPSPAPDAAPTPPPALAMRARPASPNVTRPPFPRPRMAFDFGEVLAGLPATEAEDLLVAGEVFLGYWEKEAATLTTARERGDMKDLALIAHRIKGGVGALHAKAAHATAAELENATKSGDLAVVDPLLRKLVDELHSVADGIRRALNARK